MNKLKFQNRIIILFFIICCFNVTDCKGPEATDISSNNINIKSKYPQILTGYKHLFKIDFVRFTDHENELIFTETFESNDKNLIYYIKQLDLKKNKIIELFNSKTRTNKFKYNDFLLRNIFINRKNLLFYDLTGNETVGEKIRFINLQYNDLSLNVEMRLLQKEYIWNSSTQCQFNQNYFVHSNYEATHVVKYPEMKETVINHDALIQDHFNGGFTSCFGKNKDTIIISYFNKKGTENRLCFYNYTKKRILKDIKLPLEDVYSFGQINLSPDSKFVMLIRETKGIMLYNLINNSVTEIDLNKIEYADSWTLYDVSRKFNKVLLGGTNIYLFDFSDLFKLKKVEKE